MVKTTKKISKKISKKDTQKIQYKFKKSLELIKKDEKKWSKKGEGYLMFKKGETIIKNLLPDIEKEYVSLKRCSQEHCRKEFDIIINKVYKNIKKDVLQHMINMDKTAKEIMKSRGMKKGEFINDIKDKKIQEKVRKEINESNKKMINKFTDLQKQKYGKYHKELKDCEVKHCEHESNTMKKSLKNKSKTNVFAKSLYKSIKQ